MSSKKWCITFVISVILIATLYVLFNVLVDPFGVFNDPLFNWYSYNMTNNPRVAKIGYLDKNENYKKYDSYVIGCSSTSSFPVEDLNKYMGGSWYNMIMYGADMLDVEQTCKYVIDEYNAKNIMINVFISNSYKYNNEEDNITKNMHEKLNGESKINFYTRYMFLNPQYSIAKIKSKFTDTYLTQPFDVFNAETGTYDKKVRDVEPIGTLEEYYKAYPIFANYPTAEIEMTEIDTTVASIKRIKDYCEEKNVNVTFVMAPVYSEYLKYYKKEQVEEYYTKIAQVTNYWDFTTFSLTDEPRYFYDETHFRNALGTMAIAKMAEGINENSKIYYPKDVGEYVTIENVKQHIENLWDVSEEKNEYSKKVPIITYHSLVTESSSNSEISPETFEKQIKTLKENGYTSVTFDELVSYVYEGKELPEKPICITFDDGYLNNYEVAYPILKKYNMKATIFVIGVSVGSLTNYKDTNYPITPHFTYEQAKEMEESGVISIQSHTYDMHQWKEYEINTKLNKNSGDFKIRENLAKLENDTEEEYMKVLQDDCEKLKSEIKNNLNKEVIALSYPNGKYETITNVVLKENNIKATVTINEGVNEILKGLPQSLYALNRYNMDETVTTEKMLELISQ
ncbi:MAG: polysaccharide deacetylase family protein [Clostridia bacterium]|nr:polysaccharide deacetylase family protein [Clostridia bacterium]